MGGDELSGAPGTKQVSLEVQNCQKWERYVMGYSLPGIQHRRDAGHQRALQAIREGDQVQDALRSCAEVDWNNLAKSFA